MSFWSEASPVTKGAIVVGPILIFIFALMFFGVIGGSDVETTQQRGLSSDTGSAP